MIVADALFFVSGLLTWPALLSVISAWKKRHDLPEVEGKVIVTRYGKQHYRRVLKEMMQESK